LDTELLENHKRYLERIDIYKNFGYDVKRERTFILEKSKPIEGDILEIGTGKGYFTLELAKAGYSFTSADISYDELNFALFNLEYFGLENQVILKIDDAENLSFENESFDIVFAINLIHHLKNPFKAMDEFARVVKPEGKIVLSDFHEEGFKIMDKIHTSEGRKHETGNAALEEIEIHFKNKGFNVRKHKNKFEDIIILYL
jgi:ubiquinone/menaquinone biosynthesis C-methylase UbiE